MGNYQALTDQLYTAWEKTILEGNLINTFEASEDDSEGRWSQGDTIIFGVKHHDNQHIYYANNLTQSREIQDAVEEKRIDVDDVNFVCQFNGYRALRPGGYQRPLGRQPDIPASSDQCRFFCQDRTNSLSLLVRKPLLQVLLKHFTWNAYYNAAPLETDGHFLWVPTPLNDPTGALAHFTQKLSLEFLEDAFSLFKQLSQTMLFFNSLHAGASVNHIHFQAIYHKQSLPVETLPLIDKGNYALLDGYPAQLVVFDINVSAYQIFLWIDWLQKQNIPFNLMFAGQRIILIPRNIEHEVVSEFPGSGVAALGMCGKIITVNRLAYLNANQANIKRMFRKMVLAAPHFLPDIKF